MVRFVRLLVLGYLHDNKFVDTFNGSLKHETINEPTVSLFGV